MVEVENLKLILEEILKKKRSLIITLPSYIKWEDYEKELRKAANYNYVLNFKVHNFPTGVHKGDKCYIVYNGYIIGFYTLAFVDYKTGEFVSEKNNVKIKVEGLPDKGSYNGYWCGMKFSLDYPKEYKNLCIIAGGYSSPNWGKEKNEGTILEKSNWYSETDKAYCHGMRIQ